MEVRRRKDSQTKRQIHKKIDICYLRIASSIHNSEVDLDQTFGRKISIFDERGELETIMIRNDVAGKTNVVLESKIKFLGSAFFIIMKF